MYETNNLNTVQCSLLQDDDCQNEATIVSLSQRTGTAINDVTYGNA